MTTTDTTSPGQELLDSFVAATQLRVALQESGITKAAVVRGAKISRSQLNAYLKADSQPTLPVLNRILRTMGREAIVKVGEVDLSIRALALHKAALTGAPADQIEEDYIAQLVTSW